MKYLMNEVLLSPLDTVHVEQLVGRVRLQVTD